MFCRICGVVSLVVLISLRFGIHTQTGSATLGVLGPETLVSTNADGGTLRCEPSVAADNTTVVVTWNDSYGGHHGSPTGVAIAWALSRDRGKTFAFGGYLPRANEAPVPSGADSTVIVDGKGNFLLLLLSWQKDAQRLLLYEMKREHIGEWILRSEYPSGNAKPSLIDRPSMLIDGEDRVWITFTTKRESKQQIALIWSDDRGQSWNGPIIASSGPGAKLPSRVIVERNLVTVAWIQPSKDSTALWRAISEDRGKTFSQSGRLCSGKPSSTISGYVMGISQDALTLYIPNFEIRGSGQRDDDVVVVDLPTENGYEVDEGVLPSGRLTGLFPASRSSFFPAVAGTAYGLAVMAYCRPAETTVTNVCLSIPTKDQKRRVLMLNSKSTDWSRVPGDHDAAPVQRNFGDYISLASAGGYLVAVWTDGRSGVPRVFSRVVELPH